MTSQNILYIEASKADYKEQLEEKKPRSWLKSVSAFANTHGGHLIFGVKNEPRTIMRRMESVLPTCGTATSRWRQPRGN